MSIERIKGCIAFVCDNCDDGLETGTSDFHAACAVAREEGWHVRKIDGEWNHFCCAACAEAA